MKIIYPRWYKSQKIRKNGKKVVIPYHGAKEVPRGTYKYILKIITKG
jgi:predicted RNA binding protein YcfA (HicA-like mRNA interferase family)